MGAMNDTEPIAPAVVDLRKLAKLLQMPYTTLWDQHKAGSLPIESFRVGNRILFRRSEVNKWLGIGGEKEVS